MNEPAEVQNPSDSSQRLPPIKRKEKKTLSTLTTHTGPLP